MRDFVVGILLLSAQVLTLAGFLWQRSKRKNIEANLLRLNERLRLAMEAGKSVGWDWDIASGRDVWFGDIQTFFGIRSDTHTAAVEDFFGFVHPEDRPRVAQAVADARQSRKPYVAEFRISLKDGTTRWVSARGEFQYAEDGAAARMLGLAVDVTEKKQLEEALKKSEEKYFKAFRESPLIVTLTSVRDGRFIEVNETYERITGWSRDEVVGRTSINMGIWIDIRQREEMANHLSEEGTVRDFEFSFRTREGRVRTGLLSAELIEINGEPCMLSVAADITERKSANAALRESEARFRLVAHSAPVTIWMSDANNTCIFVNQRWLELTGRPFKGQLGGWMEGIHPEDSERCLETLTKASERRESFHMEYRLRRYDGEYVWIHDSGVPRFNPDGSYSGYIGSAIDVTEIKFAEQVLSTMSQKLIEAHEAERTWIAGELHDDISQRLAMLALKLECLKRAFPASLPLLREEIEQARQQVELLMSDVQSLSRNLHPSKLKYLGLAKAAASFCEELSAQNVQIDFHSENIPSELPQEICLCLYRVLQESLQNAMKHSRSRRVQVFLGGGSNEIHLAVQDSGIGFDPVQAVNGGGIGLNSMKERLKLVNGILLIDSQRNLGTTVHARVPFNRKAQGAAS